MYWLRFTVWWTRWKVREWMKRESVAGELTGRGHIVTLEGITALAYLILVSSFNKEREILKGRIK